MSYAMAIAIREKEKQKYIKQKQEQMEKQAKVYCGSGKKKSDTWLQVSVNVDKIQDHIQELNGVKFVRLNINIKDAPDQFGKDVSLSVDTFKPEKDKLPF
jgi:hypothetical protein